MNIPSIHNMGMKDGNLSRRFSSLSKEEQGTFNDSYPDGINAKTIGELNETQRGDLKTAITNAEARDAEKKKQETEAKREGEIQAVKNQGMGDDELDGQNRLIFIGTGSGGSSDRKQYNRNLIDMKNSIYYAATKEGNEIKEITSKNNSVGPVGGKVDDLITLTKQAIIKTSDAKEEFRNRLTNTLSAELSALLPDGVKNLKFANKLKQSLQIILGYGKNENGSINGKGRVQFVPKVGNPVSTSITIKDSKYSFDDKALLSNKEAGKSFEEVADKLGLKLESEEEAIKRTETEITHLKEKIETAEGDDKVNLEKQLETKKQALDILKGPGNPVAGGKKRKTYRKTKASKAKRGKVTKKTRKARRKMRKTQR